MIRIAIALKDTTDVSKRTQHSPLDGLELDLMKQHAECFTSWYSLKIHRMTPRIQQGALIEICLEILSSDSAQGKYLPRQPHDP
jgi:hypothetical protein